MVCNNPESNMGNAVGCAPVLQMIKKGITVGLGTDSYTFDMLESLKVALIIQRHNACMPNVAWCEVTDMLFKNNRKIAAKYFDAPLGILCLALPPTLSSWTISASLLLRCKHRRPYDIRHDRPPVRDYHVQRQAAHEGSPAHRHRRGGHERPHHGSFKEALEQAERLKENNTYGGVNHERKNDSHTL